MAKKKKSMKSKTITRKKTKKNTTSKKNSNLESKKKSSTTKKKTSENLVVDKKLDSLEDKKVIQKKQSSKKKKVEELLENNALKNDIEKNIQTELPKRKSESLPKKKEEKIKEDIPKIKENIEVSIKEPVKKDKTKGSKNLGKEKLSNVKKEITNKVVSSKKKNKKISNVRKIERTKKNLFLNTIKKYVRKIKIYGIFSVISKRSMALITSGLVILLFLLVGLNYIAPKTDTIDLQSISSDIDQLKTVKFNINSSNDIVNNSKAYSNLTNYYVYDYKSTFNIDEEWVKDAVIKYNKNNKGLYMAILPNSGYEENIKNGVNKFLKNKNIDALYFEYDGYMFYINSSDNTSVVSKIKQTQVRVFDILEELNTNNIENKFGISPNLYTDYVVKTAMLKTEITGYMIFKPKNKNAALEIDKLMDEYFKNLEEKYKDDEEKLFLIQNRYEGTYNGYLVYLVSKDNDLVIQLVKK